jgi:hypothetical protein
MDHEQPGEVLQLLSEVTQIVQRMADCGEGTCIGMDGLMGDMDARVTDLRRILSWSGETEPRAAVVCADEERKDSLADLLIHDKMQELQSALDLSMKVLKERLMEIERQLRAARQSRRALKAYNNNA